MKHSQFSRLICVMMALILCVGMLPATALADNPVAYWAPIKGETEIPLNGFNDVQEKASLGGYIRLNGPLTVPSPL